jgi:hypothetical protein
MPNINTQNIQKKSIYIHTKEHEIKQNKIRAFYSKSGVSNLLNHAGHIFFSNVYQEPH